ncbi:MAG TPA: ABC transporter ATP-binding protein [Steroidobacteraceae bacterium]|jgi:iron complex transport system ATP-binding protein|nr:ABC transporter ATP-binding protein [Steroidobacteraceae bacterium]
MTASSSAGASLATHALSIRAGTRELVNALTATFSPREFIAILGRNGSGKTLTLHTLAGLRPAAAGSVRLDGAPLATLPRRKIARRIGVLLQDLEESFTTTALESVLIGRHPHLAPWQWEGPEDERIARAALLQMDLADFADRRTDTLSGGEQRRVAIAGLLAQEPDVYLVDEPTNHLDPHHQLAVLALLKDLASRGASIIASLHDPTLAARFADRVLLVFGDGTWRLGPAAEILTENTLSELYSTPMMELAAGGRRVFASA